MKSRIKILMVAKGFEIQGISNVILNYAEYINRQKFIIDVASGEHYAKSNVIRLKQAGGRFWYIPDRDKNILSYMIKLSGIIKNEKYRIVHVHGNSAMVAPELIAAKMGGAEVRIAHSHNVTCNHPGLDRLFHPVFSMFYTHALACSVEAGQWMFKKSPFIVVKNGISISKYFFDPEERKKVRQKLGIKNELVIGHIGCFNYQKNQDRLISILKKIIVYRTGVKLLFVGAGEDRERIEKLAKSQNLSEYCIFYGVSDEVEKLLAAMDVFVFPSRFEGLGIVLIEAQASGLSCIVSRNVPKEVNVTGTLKYISLEADNVKWVDAITESGLSADNTEERLLKSARQCSIIREEGYEIKDVVRRLETFYEEVTEHEKS